MPDKKLFSTFMENVLKKRVAVVFLDFNPLIMNRIVLVLLLSVASFSAFAQQELTVEKIMRDPKWIGVAPSNLVWSIDSRSLYFQWNPVNATSDSLYKITLDNRTPAKVQKQERRMIPNASYQFNKTRTKALFEKYGDIYLYDVATRTTTQITNTLSQEFSPFFSRDDKRVFYTSDQNLYSWEFGSGKISQHTDFRKGKKAASTPLAEQEKWLKEDQLRMFTVLKERDDKQKKQSEIRKSENPDRPKEIYLDEKNVDMIRISPDEKFITYRLTKIAKPKNTIVPNYVTPSGFTEDINARTKVGAALNTQELFIYDIAGDTVFQVTTNDLPGISDKITFGKSQAPKDGKEKKPENRQVSFPGEFYELDMVREWRKCSCGCAISG
jgi:hypothetical protein